MTRLRDNPAIVVALRAHRSLTHSLTPKFSCLRQLIPLRFAHLPCLASGDVEDLSHGKSPLDASAAQARHVRRQSTKPPGCRSPSSSSSPSQGVVKEVAVQLVDALGHGVDTPGHGVGPWDGVGGVAKRWAVSPCDQNASLSVNEPDFAENITSLKTASRNGVTIRRESSSPTIGPVRLLVTTLDALTHPKHSPCPFMPP